MRTKSGYSYSHRPTIIDDDLPQLRQLLFSFDRIHFDSEGEHFIAQAELTLPVVGKVTASYSPRERSFLVWQGSDGDELLSLSQVDLDCVTRAELTDLVKEKLKEKLLASSCW